MFPLALGQSCRMTEMKGKDCVGSWDLFQCTKCIISECLQGWKPPAEIKGSICCSLNAATS